MSTVTKVRPRVEKLLRQVLGTQELLVDEYGNWPLRWGSAGYVVRLVQAPGLPPVVQIFSPVLGGVGMSPAILEVINAINSQISFGRVAWVNNVVVASTELVAETVDLLELQISCGAIAFIADSYDNALQRQFGGVISFDSPPQGAGEPQFSQAEQAQSGSSTEDVTEAYLRSEARRSQINSIISSGW